MTFEVSAKVPLGQPTQGNLRSIEHEALREIFSTDVSDIRSQAHSSRAVCAGLLNEDVPGLRVAEGSRRLHFLKLGVIDAPETALPNGKGSGGDGCGR